MTQRQTRGGDWTPGGLGAFDRLSDDTFREVVDAVRYEMAGGRAAIHRLLRLVTCDVRIAVLPSARLDLTGDCLCLDYLVDMLVEAEHFLATATKDLHNPPGAVRAHVRKRSADWTRRRRVEQGAQARTDRLHRTRLAAGLPDDYHRSILRFLADEAGSMAPLAGGDALLRRLAHLAAEEFGGSEADHVERVRPAMAVVEEACRARVAQAEPLVTWWLRYIDEPMGRRSRLDDLPLDAAAVDAVEIPGREAVDHEEYQRGIAVIEIVLAVAATAPDQCLFETLQDAVDELVRQDLISPTAARRFVDDPKRMGQAAEQVKLLTAA